MWSFIDNNTNDDEEEEDLDTDSLLNAREVATLQLQDLFGQDLFDFDTSDSPYYDEFTFGIYYRNTIRETVNSVNIFFFFFFT